MPAVWYSSALPVGKTPDVVGAQDLDHAVAQGLRGDVASGLPNHGTDALVRIADRGDLEAQPAIQHRGVVEGVADGQHLTWRKVPMAGQLGQD